MRAAEKGLAQVIEKCFPVGAHAVHTKGGRPIRVQVEMVNSNSVKVWNPNSGKSQWIHYFHFLPESISPNQESK
jgi:hypothetical protein